MRKRATPGDAAVELTTALQAIGPLHTAYEDARAAEASARHACTAALNALNTQQRVIDTLVDEMRGVASGDWDQRNPLKRGQTGSGNPNIGGG